eukprot:tig00021365_g20827.t1
MQSGERCIRHEYDAVTSLWQKQPVNVVLDEVPFAEGAMRVAFRCTINVCGSTPFVAKFAKDAADGREVCFRDVQSQMLAKYWAQEFNKRKPPKTVDFIQCWVLEFVDRPGRPCAGLENFVPGVYEKHNNNVGRVSDIERNTPQAFSHFTYEASRHQILVCDIQGVNDLYTDPQIHTHTGMGFGRGNLGMAGIRSFLLRHRCNALCGFLGLPLLNQKITDLGTQPAPRAPGAGPPEPPTFGAVPSMRNSPARRSIGTPVYGSRDMRDRSPQPQRSGSILQSGSLADLAMGQRAPLPLQMPPQPFLDFDPLRFDTIDEGDDGSPKGKGPVLRAGGLGALGGTVAGLSSSLSPTPLAAAGPGGGASRPASPLRLPPSSSLTSSGSSSLAPPTTAGPAGPTAPSPSPLPIPPAPGPGPPPGLWVLTGSADKTVKVWEADTQRCVATFSGHMDWVNSLAVADMPLGPVVFSASADRTLRAWFNGQCVAAARCEEPLTCIASAPPLLFGGTSKKILRVWDLSGLERGQLRAIGAPVEGHEGAVKCAAVSSDGRLVTGGADDKVKVWACEAGAGAGAGAAGGAPLSCTAALSGHTDAVNSLVVLGRRIVSGSADEHVRVWDLDSGRCLRVLETNSLWVNCLCACPGEGRLFVGCGDGSVRALDTEAWEFAGVLRGHVGPVYCLATSEGHLFSGSYDKSVRCWNARTLECVWTSKGHEGPVYSIAVASRAQR